MRVRFPIAGAVGLMVAAILLSACHIVGHVPPGQVKHIVNPPPGHGGTPPGHRRR